MSRYEPMSPSYSVMKNILFLFVTLSVFSAFSEGVFIFNNFEYTSGPSPVTIGNTSAPGEGSVGAYLGADYTASVYYLPGVGFTAASFESGNPIHFPGADTPFFGDTGFPAGNFTAPRPGLFDGGGVTLPASGSVTVQVRAWYNIGAISYDDAMAKGYNVGKSNPIEIQLSLYPVAPEALNSGIPGLIPFTVNVVPEPTTASLLFFGFATAALLKRRNHA